MVPHLSAVTRCYKVSCVWVLNQHHEIRTMKHYDASASRTVESTKSMPMAHCAFIITWWDAWPLLLTPWQSPHSEAHSEALRPPEWRGWRPLIQYRAPWLCTPPHLLSCWWSQTGLLYWIWCHHETGAVSQWGQIWSWNCFLYVLQVFLEILAECFGGFKQTLKRKKKKKKKKTKRVG